MDRAVLRVIVTAAATAAITTSISVPAHAATTTLGELLVQLPVAAEDQRAYSRDYFEHWIDADGDGCDTRQEVLIAETHSEPTIGPGCSISDGLWWSYLDNQEWTDPSRVDIDHTVALQEAWQSGAWAWTLDQRRAYANDLDYLFSLNGVTDSVNSSKSASDPADWLPPATDFTCDYLSFWVGVKYRWNLTVDPAEKSAIEAQTACASYALDVPDQAAVPPATVADDQLTTGERLDSGQQIVSSNGAYQLVMQGDGNAVVYGPSGPRWATGTGFVGSAFIVMQGDGNLVVYSAGGRPAWASGTGGVSGGVLVLQDDGNLVMYRGDGSPAWVNGQVVRPPASDALPAGKVLPTGEFLQSRNGAWRLVMQTDGHAVVYGPGRIGWVSGTGGVGPAFLAMQGDGNAVIYTNSGRPVWASGTGGVSNPTLVMQDDGNLVMYASGAAVWVNGMVIRPQAPPPPTPPQRPNDVDCGDFTTQREAQQWFDTYYPYYGDIASLDSDGDREACESLP